jgi:hypothetical protein
MGDNDYINDCLTSNPLETYKNAGKYIVLDDMGNAGSLAKTNFEPWEPVPVEPNPAYNGFSLSDGESEGETLEEVIKRVVKEVIGQITEGGTLVAPKIEKYHIKHK